MLFQNINWTKLRPQIVAVSVKNLLLFGYGLISSLVAIIIPDLMTVTNTNESLILTNEQIAWIGSISLITLPLGCIFSGYITERLGRKIPMQFVNIPLLLTWLLYAYSSQVEHIYIAQSMVGFCGGLMEAPVLTYVAEITENYLRGILSATAILSVMIGVFFTILLGNVFHWRQVALILSFVPSVTFFTFFIVPESPYWLTAHNQIQKARENLAWLRGTKNINDISTEFKDIEKNVNASKLDPNSHNDLDAIRKRYWSRSFLKPFSLIVLAFLISNFCGMLPLHTYAIVVFETFHSPISGQFANLILVITDLVSVVILLVLTSRYGRRLLTVSPTILCGICLLTMSYYGYTNQITKLEVPTNDTISYQLESSWIPTVALLLGSFFSHIGVKLVPWILIGEVFNSETKSVATGLSTSIYYMAAFFMNNYFLVMIELVTLWGLILIFGIISILGGVILYFVMPETEGKSLNEIEMHFSGVKKLSNKVERKGNIYVISEHFQNASNNKC